MVKRMDLLGFCVDDRRLSAPDVKGILADYQIRKQQLDEIAEEVDKNWSGVCRVCVGNYPNQPYFAIHLEPFSENLQRQHLLLADRIDSIIGVDNFAHYFLPKMEQIPFSSEIVIYNRNNISQ